LGGLEKSRQVDVWFMATFGYNIQALDKAIEILARDEGDIRERVRKAAPDLLSLEASVCPSSWRRDIRWIQRRLTTHIRKFFDPNTGDENIGYDFSMAIQYRVTAKKIADRVWRLSFRRRDADRCEMIEAEHVEICGVGKNPYIQIECPQCHTAIQAKLSSTKTRRCSCGYRWRAEIVGIGTKK
jgi:hypothetical protein